MSHTPAAVAVLASPLVIPQGADFACAWVYAEGTPAGIPAGWPNQWTGRMEVRESRAPGARLIARFHTWQAADGVVQLTTLNAGTPSTVSGIPDGGSAGLVTLVTTQAASSTWAWADAVKAYPFDLELASVTGRVIRLLEGTIRLSGEVTVGG